MRAVLREKLIALRNRHFFVTDVVTFIISPILVLGLLDGITPLSLSLSNGLGLVFLLLVVKLGLLYCVGFYKRCWQYASIDELQQIGILAIAIMLLETAVVGLWSSVFSATSILPRSFPLFDGMMSVLLLGCVRFSVRLVDRLSHQPRRFYRRDRVLIVGAGSAGVTLAQEMQRNPSLGFCPVAFIDDDPAKLNLQIRRLPVVGDRTCIAEYVRTHRIRRVVIAMPSVPGQVIRDIVRICQETNIPTSTLPSLDEILNGRASINTIRDVQIEDLLRREPIQIDSLRVKTFLYQKKVLITGAGGSIGSELCRQVLQCQPVALFLLGHGENSVFNIHQELERTIQTYKAEGQYSGHVPQLSSFIGDVRSLPRLQYAFEQFRPDIIFHAAAHKHVPMMELNSPEAITNNIQGTKNLVDLAVEYGVKHFVMVSTDKAVNPTNIMGTSKRVAEMLVLQTAQQFKRHYVVVRFGNVLGSRGSVVPTFKRQIAEGGPVTVTHPDICRYFMTIPEAVQLMMQAATLGKGGEVFMLDMGQPVKIVDLAKELIRLSGFEVGKHIDIKFTGLRPGEKLYEELFVPGESYEPTEHPKLFVVPNASRLIPNNLGVEIAPLCQAALNNDALSIRVLLQQLVPEYAPSSPTYPTSDEATDTVPTQPQVQREPQTAPIAQPNPVWAAH
ncbi:MAG: nucleoside-diphosphate sugar epimerase/dehydratase [Synechococcales bacterium]|nr:nucleoside-diphosphate sugar epimerase/dehydratase [Synechococcales bacterium]